MGKFGRFIKVMQNAVGEMIRRDVMPDSQYDKLINIYPEWAVNTLYMPGNHVRHKGKLYEVIFEHTSLAGWEPDTTPAVFKEIAPPNVIKEWKQPYGYHDAYNKGDKVIFDNKVWVSTVDQNTRQPGVFGWDQV